MYTPTSFFFVSLQLGHLMCPLPALTAMELEVEVAGVDTEEFFFLKTGDSSTDLKRSQSKLSSFQKLLPQPTSLLVLEPGGKVRLRWGWGPQVAPSWVG